jgi:hypothetical protein
MTAPNGTLLYSELLVYQSVYIFVKATPSCHFAELSDDGATLQTCNTMVPVYFLLPVGLERNSVVDTTQSYMTNPVPFQHALNDHIIHQIYNDIWASRNVTKSINCRFTTFAASQMLKA